MRFLELDELIVAYDCAYIRGLIDNDYSISCAVMAGPQDVPVEQVICGYINVHGLNVTIDGVVDHVLSPADIAEFSDYIRDEIYTAA